MKHFQVRHRIGSAIIEADTYAIEGHLMRFYQVSVVVAEYAAVAVVEVRELTSTHRAGAAPATAAIEDHEPSV